MREDNNYPANFSCNDDNLNFSLHTTHARRQQRVLSDYIATLYYYAAVQQPAGSQRQHFGFTLKY